MSRFAQTSVPRLLSFTLFLALATSTAALPQEQAGKKFRDRSASADRQPQHDRTATAERRGSTGHPSRDRKSPSERQASPGRENVPEPNPQQQENLQELRASLGVLADGAVAAEDEIRGLAQDLQGMALQPPDSALTQALAADLANAMEDASLTPKEMALLTQDVYAVMNSAGLDQQEFDMLKDNVEDILTASGVDRGDVEAVLDDLQAIYEASPAGQPGTSTRRARGNKLGRDG